MCSMLKGRGLLLLPFLQYGDIADGENIVV